MARFLTVRTILMVLVVLGIGGLGLKFLSPSHAATGTGFITRSHTELMLNGQQYKFAGVNANGMVYPGCRGESAFPTQAQLDQFFGSLGTHSMTRIWYLDNSSSYQASMDMVVATAQKYHQFLDVTLTDALSQCGDPINKSGNFWTSGYQGAYWTHVRDTVTRYKDSPAIGIWEMANEGTGGGNNNFYLSTAALIKSIDPNHLVATGSMPEYAFGSQSSYEQSASGPNIDLVSVHEYDAATGESGWVTGAGDQAARDLDKPLYVGEDGFCDGCGNPYAGNTGSDAGNAAKLLSEYTAYLNDPVVAGMLYWNFDFGGTKGDVTTMAFGTQLFATPAKVNNPYPGGPDGVIGPTPNPTTASTPTVNPAGTYNDTSFTYVGTGWQTSNDTPKYQGDDHYSSTANDSASLTFDGTQVKLYGANAPYYGIAAISIDGGAEVTTDLYAATRSDQVLFYTSPVLASGKHTVRLRVTGSHDAMASDSIVSLDKADVVASTASPVSSPTATPVATPLPTPTGLLGDINHDGHVTSADLATLLSHWGQSVTPNANGDLNSDGKVTSVDLALMLSNWGK